MTDEQAPAEAEPADAGERRPEEAGRDPSRPDYKGAPLDPGRGPGLGCFWAQTVVFLTLFVLTPYGVINGWPAGLTTAMLIVTLILLLFVGQTVIFLLRLVSADRRSRRRPLRAGAGPTVGDLAATAATNEPAVADADVAEPANAVEPPEGDGLPAVRQ